jgi:hypothetical protein
MRTFKIFFALMMVCLFAAQVNAQGNSQNQNGNAVLSSVDVTADGNGTVTLEIKISGNLSGTVEAIQISVSGELIPGGTYSTYVDHSRYLEPNPIFLATVPVRGLNEFTNGDPDEWVDVEVAYGCTTCSGGARKLIKKARMPKDVIKIAN